MQTMMTVMNGVDCVALGATIEAIEGNNEIAKFQFRANNRWVNGGHNVSAIQGFYGACEEDTKRAEPFVLDAAEPPILLGNDEGPNPVEYLLHALASCMTTSMVYHAAARGIEIESVESKLEGDLDLRGFLGLNNEVRKGYREIRVVFDVKSEASADQLKQCAYMSPVLDCVGRGVPVSVEVRVRN